MKRAWLRLTLVALASLGFYWYTHSAHDFITSRVTFLNPLGDCISCGFSYGTSCCMWVGSKLAYPFKQYALRSCINKELAEKLESMRHEREELIAQVIELSQCKYLYEDIRELVDYKKRYKNQTSTIATILVKQFSPAAHFFLIDAGSKKNIKPDMIVVYKNCLIGRISQVFPLYSRVDLITDKHCKVAVQTNKAKYKGIHEGLCVTDTTQVTHLYDNTLQLENKVKVGELIVSSGDGLIFPRGFVLGRITAITRNDFNCTLTLEPLIDLKTLEYCSVLLEDS